MLHTSSHFLGEQGAFAFHCSFFEALLSGKAKEKEVPAHSNPLQPAGTGYVDRLPHAWMEEWPQLMNEQTRHLSRSTKASSEAHRLEGTTKCSVSLAIVLITYTLISLCANTSF